MIAPARITLVGLLTLIVWLVVFSVAYWIGIAMAHAGVATTGSAPDPAATVDLITKLWRSGAIPAAMIVASYWVLRLASLRIAWLREGTRAAYVAAFVGVLGTLADAIQRGETPTTSMVIVSMAVQIALLASPTPPPKKPAPAPSEVTP